MSVRGCSKGANTGSFLTWALFSSLSLFFTSLPLPFFSVSPHSTYLEVFGKRYTAPCFSSFSPPGLLHGRYLDFCAIYPHTHFILSLIRLPCPPHNLFIPPHGYSTLSRYNPHTSSIIQTAKNKDASSQVRRQGIHPHCRRGDFSSSKTPTGEKGQR